MPSIGRFWGPHPDPAGLVPRAPSNALQLQHNTARRCRIDISIEAIGIEAGFNPLDPVAFTVWNNHRDLFEFMGEQALKALICFDKLNPGAPWGKGAYHSGSNPKMGREGLDDFIAAINDFWSFYESLTHKPKIVGIQAAANEGDGVNNIRNSGNWLQWVDFQVECYSVLKKSDSPYKDFQLYTSGQTLARDHRPGDPSMNWALSAHSETPFRKYNLVADTHWNSDSGVETDEEIAEWVNGPNHRKTVLETNNKTISAFEGAKLAKKHRMEDYYCQGGGFGGWTNTRNRWVQETEGWCPVGARGGPDNIRIAVWNQDVANDLEAASRFLGTWGGDDGGGGDPVDPEDPKPYQSPGHRERRQHIKLLRQIEILRVEGLTNKQIADYIGPNPLDEDQEFNIPEQYEIVDLERIARY